jgi:hypothetical protein
MLNGKYRYKLRLVRIVSLFVSWIFLVVIGCGNKGIRDLGQDKDENHIAGYEYQQQIEPKLKEVYSKDLEEEEKKKNEFTEKNWIEKKERKKLTPLQKTLIGLMIIGTAVLVVSQGGAVSGSFNLP